MSNLKKIAPTKSAVGVAIASLFAMTAYSGVASAAAKITIQKTVTVASSACTSGTVESMTVGRGTQIEYCYVMRNRSTAGEDLFNVKFVEKFGTSSTSDDLTVRHGDITGLVDLDGDGRQDDLAAGAVASASIVTTMSKAGTFKGFAVATADSFAGGSQAVRAQNAARVIVSKDKIRSMTVRKTVVESTQQCPGTVSLTGVYSGDSVKYCYEVENLGDFDIEDLKVVDNLGSVGSTVVVPMTLLQDIDGDADTGDLMPGAIAVGEYIQPVTQAEGTVVSATATALSSNMKKRAKTRFTVAKGSEGACSVEMTAVPSAGSCPGGSSFEVTGTTSRFCYRVTNTGSSALTNLTIKDSGHGTATVATFPSLAVGAASSWYSRGNALFSARFDDHIGEATAEDGFGNEVACTADAATAVKYADTSPPSPDVFLEKKISLNGICTVAENNGAVPTLYDEVTVPKGTKVWYCYRMRNNLAQKWPYNNGDVPDGKLTDAQFPGEQLYHFKLNIWANSELTARKGPIVVNDTMHTTATVRVSTLSPNVYLNDTATVRVEEGNLRLKKSALSSSVDTTSTRRINYTLTAENTGTAAMPGSKIIDNLSKHVTFVSAVGCNYNSNLHRVTCQLGTMAGGAQKSRVIEVNSKLRTGIVTNKACVESLYGETTNLDNCSTQKTRLHVGTTRNRQFWENNTVEMQQCLAANNNLMSVGFMVLRNETSDDQLDAYTLPVTASSLIGDIGKRKEKAIDLSLGLLNANELKLIGNKARTNQATWCVRAAKELVAATCNVRHFGASDVVNLVNSRTAIRKNCRHTTSTKIRNTRTKALKIYRARLKRFNESGMSIAAPTVSAANPLSLRADDPTDRKD